MVVGELFISEDTQYACSNSSISRLHDRPVTHATEL
jgi:hypothetical protein